MQSQKKHIRDLLHLGPQGGKTLQIPCSNFVARPTYDEAVEKSLDKEDEENRVWYVGVTRTKQNLYIMAAKKEAKGYDIEGLQ